MPPTSIHSAVTHVSEGEPDEQMPPMKKPFALPLNNGNAHHYVTEADYISGLQEYKRPIADVSFIGGKLQRCSISAVQLGQLLITAGRSDPIVSKTLVHNQLSFVIPILGCGTIIEGANSTPWSAGQRIMRFSFANPIELQYDGGFSFITIHPSLEALRTLVESSDPAQIGLIDRLQNGQTDVQSGEVNGVNYHEQLGILLSIVESCDCDEELLEKIGIEDVFNRVLAAFLVGDFHPNGDLSIRQYMPSNFGALDDICDHVRQNVGRPLTLTKMEEISGLNTRALTLAFQARFNCTPQQWQRNFLLDEARSRLVSEELQQSIHAIAYQLGFSSARSFSAHYKDRFGETPSNTIDRRKTKVSAYGGKNSTTNSST